jgi:hypothetical protein
MKKAVFLFLLATIFIFNVDNQVIGSEDIYQVNNNEIIITSIKEEGITGFTIEKAGVNPFFSTIIHDSEHYFITGVKQINDYFVVYGYGFTNNSDTEYDSLFFVFDSAGNTIFKDLRDYGSMETIKNIFYIDDVFIVYTESVNDINQTYEFNSNYFVSYDHSFNYLDSIEISPKIYKLDSNDMYILIGYDNAEYDLAIRSDLSLIKKTDLLTLTEGQIFIESVTIEFINGAIINNDFVENGVTIIYPGDYTLNYNNRIYNFTVVPVITGVIDNEIYTESIMPTISGGNVVLNNDIYVSNTEISNPGNYDFTVNGANNYVESLSFTITSNLDGIINNNSYLDPVTLDFNGDGYLNNQFIESPHEVIETGDYILKIRGENNYMETYYFSIEEDEVSTSFVDFIQRVDILVLVVVLISGGIILKKK